MGTCNITKRRTVRKTNSSSWDIIQEAKKVYRCELEFDTLNKRVNIYEKRGSDKGVYFLDSLNLKELSIQGDSYDFYTRIIAKGKGDLKVTLENFQYSSKVKTYIWKDERYIDIDSLTEDAKAKLEELSKPYRAYSATIIDLANISKKEYKDILSYSLGDVITLVSKENRIKEKQRIVKIIEYPDEPTRNTCEIANTTLSFEDIQKEFQDTTDTVNNITTDNGTIDGSTINGVSTEQIYDFEASVVKITDLKIVNARIDDLYANKANISQVNAVIANIAELNATKANLTDLNAINANIQNLIANDVKINNALINKADITELNAVVGNINIINSELANIKTLVNGNLSSENIQAGGITSDKLTIANGFITNAMIDNLDVSKINAGNISTNKFRIVSDNGGIEIVGATQQFKDKNNKIRIQMGQDAKGNFNFILRGEDGTTTLIDHTGIKEKAIADNLIKGNMVATDAIGEKQINYSSLITGLNKDTNTQLIKASKVAIDFVGQSLEVAFNSLKNQADNAKLLIENHSTTIGVMQGQINTAINNTQIVKDGKTILLKDDYNRTVSKVDSINSTIGTHTTKINELTGNITSVDTKVNSIQRDLEGTKSTVSSHTNLIDGLNSKVSTQGSSIEQLKNQITLKVNSTELTTMKNELIGKIDSIEIGGRNTLLNATGNLGNTNHWSNVVLDTNKKVEGCNSFKITRNNFANGNARYQGSQTIDLSRLSLKANDYITLSGWVYVDSSINLTGSSNEFAFRNYYNSSASFEDLCVFKYANIQKNTWTKFSVTSKVTKDSYKAGALLLSISANGLIYVSKLKLEKGSKATDFTLAPEDIDSVIGTKAEKTDVYSKSEVYTKSQTDSAINIAKDSINLGVSQTYETKTNVTSKVNTAKTEAVNSAVATSKSYADTKKAEAISTASTDATNKVNSAKTELNTAINKKANSTDVYTKSETYTKAQTDSAIKVAKDSIELGVKNTYETKSNVENKISTAVNNVQIGGRNLAIGTSDSWKSASGFSGATNYCVFRHVINTKTLSVGDRLTVSFRFKCENLTNNNTARVIRIQGSGDVTGWNSGAFNSYNIPLDYSKPTQEIKINYTITITADHLKNSKWNINFRTDYITGGTIYLKELLAEKGTKASSWTPAPEDVDLAIDKKANIVDVYKKSETYTKSETDSAINIAKDSINLGVSQTYETKTNVTSKVNTAKTEAVNTSKSYADTKKTEAINSANATTTEKLKSYSTTAQMNSAIQVAKDSITNTVSSTYAKKADVESTYATKSSLTQTANNITARFESSGGYNLVKNSAFKKGLNGWNTDNIDTDGTSKSITYWTDSNQYILPDTNAVVIRGTNLTERYGVSQTIKIKRGQKYTVSALSASHRGKTIRITVRNANKGEHLLNVVSTNLASAGKNIANWNKMEGVFTAPTDSDNIILCLYMDCSGSDGYVWFTQLMINEGDVKQPWSPHPDEVYNGSTVIDASGVTINNGALTVKNNAGKTVLSGDSNGNLDITGTVKSQRGNMYVSLDYGGLTFQSAHNNEQLLRMETTSFTSDKNVNGVDLNLAKQGEYISFNHINKENLNNGWSSSDGRYNFMDFWSKDTTLGSKTYKKGINVNSAMYVNKGLKLYSGTNFYADIDGAISWNNGTGTVSNLLGMYGDNGAVLGYKSGDSFNARFLVTEDSHPGTGDNIISWGNYNFNGYTFHNANIVAKSLSVQGSKNCLQETKSYGARLINAYETAEYYFGDIGFGKINEEGVCYVDIDDVFLECVNTDAQYHVFTQIYNGKITSIERYKTYFIVKGEQNTEFSWELKAKRKGYEINRLDLPDIETQGDEIDIFSFENEIETDEEDLMKELTFELENLLLKEHEEDE